jgi:hypothetical protein
MIMDRVRNVAFGLHTLKFAAADRDLAVETHEGQKCAQKIAPLPFCRELGRWCG